MFAGFFSISVLLVLLFGQQYFPRKIDWTVKRDRVRGFAVCGTWSVLTLAWIWWGYTTCKIIIEPNDELWSAAGRNELTEAKILLWRGANPNAKIDKVGSPLKHAVNENHQEMVRLLLAHGGDANATAGTWGNDSLAAYAAYSNFPEVLELLLKNGADANKGDARNKPLAMACRKGNVECIKILITYGADVNATDDSGVTSLQFVSQFGCPNKDEVVKLLQFASKTPAK